MKLADIVSFRKDLLFNGAVQIGWYENDRAQAKKAAENYVFHGPSYHGVAEADFDVSTHQLLDTANFTLDILHRISGRIADEPFALAIAGYGTGKSHLGVTLASLLSDPYSKVAGRVLDNISRADASIGAQIKNTLNESNQPYLVVAINGMKDFDLGSEIIRQTMLVLHEKGLDTKALDNLRPRFKTAVNFTEAFFTPLKADFDNYFGLDCPLENILESLKCQDEEVFSKVSEIYRQKMGSPIVAVGQESLHDFISLAKETYCGPGKSFVGILIIFDEFGRYLEFSVQKPHIAGAGALQQLFECVQANGDGVFLLCFIQYELKAYISRVAPELREDLNRYVTRYDSVRRVRLSTNLETLIANLMEKKNSEILHQQLEAMTEKPESVQQAMKRWFPDINNHAVWVDKDRFQKVIFQGCWPLHPASTWVLYKLSSVGKSLQQRSALSLLTDVYDAVQNTSFRPGSAITPVDLCTDSMISEFLASERYGQQGASAHAYENVLHKYQLELNKNEKGILKSVLLAGKIGVKVDSKDEYLLALSMFSGLQVHEVQPSVTSLESEYAVLDWNERLQQYEIAGDAVPKRAFIAHLESKVGDIDFQTRANIFSQNYLKWFQKDIFNTDFGLQNNISTREWNYKISYTNVTMLKGQVNYVFRTWIDARGVDQEKGQLIYCYVGGESDIEASKELAIESIKSSMKENNIDWTNGAPVCVLLLHDTDGEFGKKIAEYWVLHEQMNDEESQKYANFILDRKNSVQQELQDKFSELERARKTIFAMEKQIPNSRIKNMLTELFNVVYHKRIQFPFDGFHTTKGNAARDCQLFTRELFLGNLDKDWVAARSAQQRNRAYEVLDESWGVIDKDGSIRLRPKNNAIRHIIELIESLVENSDKPLNMGEIIRLLCSAPYGCNIASAGMLIALFIGRRKKTINLIKNKQAVSTETWIQYALPGNFLEISILDCTKIIRVSQESISEWEKLLDDWEAEETLWGKVGLRRKSRDLEKRISIPQSLYYRYKYLNDNSSKAVDKLAEYEKKLKLAIDMVKKGSETDDFMSLSSGTVELNVLNDMMGEEGTEWTKQQIEEVQSNLAQARLQTHNRFKHWLKLQNIQKFEQLSEFKYNMLNIIGGSLSKLGYEEEYRLLETHVHTIVAQMDFIVQTKSMFNDIDNLVQNNRITDSTSIYALNNWLELIKTFKNRIEDSAKVSNASQFDFKSATKKLSIFKESCKNQITRYKERVNNIYNIDKISTLSDLASWRNEVSSLILIYQGEEQNVEDLKLVQRQLDIIEIHYRRLDDDSLYEEEFEEIGNRCIEETDNEFFDDAPPLDSELIYNSIKNSIRAKREQVALGWMQRNVPELKEITKLNANETMDRKTRLQKIPSVLSREQVNTVREAIGVCEKRFDELEVEGLVVKFKSLSEGSKKIFLNKISIHLKNIIGLESL